jgi:hypothetical protein
MSVLVIVIIGVILAVILLLAHDEPDLEVVKAIAFCSGLILLTICLVLLYWWNFGTVGNKNWTLSQGVTYEIISQSDAETEKGGHVNVAVLQDAASKELFCITTDNKVPDKTGFVRLATGQKGGKVETNFAPVETNRKKTAVETTAVTQKSEKPATKK